MTAESHRDPTAAWEIAEADFPRAGSLSDKLRFLVGYAVLAPSSHNSQPWRFRLLSAGIEVLADRERRLPASDPQDRELVVSCGAALHNLRLAVRHFGYLDRVAVLPEGADSDLIARLEIGDSPREAGEEAETFARITERHTNRACYEPRGVPGGVQSTCLQAAHAHGAWLHYVEADGEREDLARLVSEADRRQAADKAFRDELTDWLHPNRYKGGDGMPGYAFGLGDVLSFAAPLIIRTFDWGQGKAAEDREIALGSPLLAVLGTGDDAPEDWVRAGEALQSVLLHCQAEGVQCAYLNQAVEIPELRRQLRDRLDLAGYPQIVLRMGYAEPVSQPTPRRSLDDFIVE